MELFLILSFNVNLKSMKEKLLLDEMIKLYKLESNRLFFDLTPHAEEIISIEEDLHIDKLKKKFPLIFNKNKINRYFIKNVTIPNPIIDFMECRIFQYKELILNFDIYKNVEKNIATLLLEKVNDLLFVELEIFFNLFNLRDIPIKNKKDHVTCLIGLTLSLILLNKVRNKHIDQAFLDENFDKLYKLMKKTKCFYQKMNVLLSFMYEIMEWNQILRNKYKVKFMKKLSKYKVIPTISMLIKGKNLNNVPNYIRNTFNFRYESIEEVTYEKHEHFYELFDNLLDPYKCSECGECIKIKVNESDEIKLENPRDILLRLIEEIMIKNTAYINDLDCFYQKWHDDLYQISFLSFLYFRIPLFSNTKSKND